MITAVLAAVFCLPLSFLLVIGFFLQKPQEDAAVLSARNLKFALLHGLLLAGSFGSVMILMGVGFQLVHMATLLGIIAATDLAIVHALKP